MWTRSVSIQEAPDDPEYIEMEFERGDPVAIDGERLSPASMLTRLNELGHKHGAPHCLRRAAHAESWSLCAA